MHFQAFPSPRAWKRHTGRAHQVGLSAGALACLGTEPHAHADPASFTGYIGTVKILGRDDAVTAGQLAAEAIGAGRGVVAKNRGPILLHPARADLQTSRRRARPRQARARHPQPRRRPTHRGLRRHHAPHRPRSRQGKRHPAGGLTHATLHHYPLGPPQLRALRRRRPARRHALQKRRNPPQG